MQTAKALRRPPFEDALQAWNQLLARRGFPAEITWVLEENLCFEREPAAAGGVKLGFQTRFTPHPADAAKVTYHFFAETAAPVVFYRLGTSGNRSVCILLCDAYFNGKDEREGYVRMDEWLVCLHPGGHDSIEEITDPERWRKRIVRGRPLTALDFCMTLSAIRELAAHGRVLTPDERLGLKILRRVGR
jgi:hypothetical protein